MDTGSIDYISLPLYTATQSLELEVKSEKPSNIESMAWEDPIRENIRDEKCLRHFLSKEWNKLL
jgi:hypothetical protein